MPARALPNDVRPGTPESAASFSDPENALALFATDRINLAQDLLVEAGRQSGKNILAPKCLLPESVRTGEGVGPVVVLEDHSAKLLVVTLGITAVVERTGLTVSIWGSTDQNEWGSKPLLTFRERQYCGVYSALLNLARQPEIRYLRVQWNMNRWGKIERTPLFGFEVFLEESGARVSSSAVA